MIRVRLLREAAEELEAIAQYYDAERAGLGRAFIAEVRRARQRVQEHPLASAVERSEVRSRAVARFPYRIYYRVRENELLIIAIAHRRRQPGYWQARI